MNYKAVIFDLDGTAMISSPNAVPSDKLCSLINSAQKKINITCATGRNWPFGKNAIQKLNLICPSIISGGAQIVDSQTGYKIWQVSITKQASKKIFDYVNTLDFAVDINDDLPNNDNRFKKCDLERDLYLINIKQVLKKDFQSIVDILNTIEGILCVPAISQRPDYFDLHITSSEATKEKAVHQFSKMLNLHKNEIIGIGDAPNDLHLFNAVGYKIAMGNAEQQIKNVADFILPPISEDGLTYFFEQIDNFV